MLKWLSKELGVAQRDITLVRDQTLRRKQLRLQAGSAAEARWKRLLTQP